MRHLALLIEPLSYYRVEISSVHIWPTVGARCHESLVRVALTAKREKRGRRRCDLPTGRLNGERAILCRSPHSSSVWPNTAVKGKLERSRLANRQLDERTAFPTTCSESRRREPVFLPSFYRYSRLHPRLISRLSALSFAFVLFTCNNRPTLCCHPSARVRTFWG